MAKKNENVLNLVDTFQEFKELKSIDRTTLINVLEESFRSVIAKMFGSDKNYDVIVNPDKGDFEIRRNRVVVADEDLTDPNAEIAEICTPAVQNRSKILEKCKKSPKNTLEKCKFRRIVTRFSGEIRLNPIGAICRHSALLARLR